LKGKSYTVGFDKRALTINNKHAIFLSGAVHPPRGTPEMWDGWFDNAKKNNLNMLQVYIFW
jgi:beta-galactosidase GanA